jgi:hypothetical protein
MVHEHHCGKFMVNLVVEIARDEPAGIEDVATASFSITSPGRDPPTEFATDFPVPPCRFTPE